MLQRVGPSERFFHELKVIEETKFRFAEEVPAVEYVEDMVENMQLYPPEDYITGSELFFEYDPEVRFFLKLPCGKWRPGLLALNYSVQSMGSDMLRIFSPTTNVNVSIFTFKIAAKREYVILKE